MTQTQTELWALHERLRAQEFWIDTQVERIELAASTSSFNCKELLAELARAARDLRTVRRNLAGMREDLAKVRDFSGIIMRRL